MPDSKLNRRTVFVTVGTTCFDKLVTAVDTREVKQELWRRGFTHLVIQMGRGTYTPTKCVEDGTLNVDYFTFSSSIADHLRSASLVISHAGSGSIFESLRLGKPLIVVVNEDLMDNHQSELAEELAERKHLYYARPQTLQQIIADMDLDSLLPYTPAPLTTKSDVYSYGVVLLELLTGRVPVDSKRPPGEHVLVSWALPRLTNRENVVEMLDPALQGNYSTKDLVQIAAIAAVCVQPEADYRPLMTDVVQSLIPLAKNLTSLSCSGSSGHQYIRRTPSVRESLEIASYRKL